jgi:hypothetical protein
MIERQGRERTDARERDAGWLARPTPEREACSLTIRIARPEPTRPAKSVLSAMSLGTPQNAERVLQRDEPRGNSSQYS